MEDDGRKTQDITLEDDLRKRHDTILEKHYYIVVAQS